LDRCFLWGDIPFIVSMKNMFYQLMLNDVATVCPWYKAPTYEELRDPVLQNENLDYFHGLEKLRESWKSPNAL